MSRLFVFAWLVAAMALPAAAQTTASPIHKTTFLPASTRQFFKTDIEAIEKYLTNLTTIVADFTQFAPDGSLSTGKFFLKRPGKMRWQYNPPTPVLIIANGSQMVFFDRELEQVNYIPIDESLIGFMTKKQIRFGGSVGITDMERKAGVIRVTLAERDKPEEGSLMLEFTDEPLLIRNMVIRDATNQITSLSLNNARFGSKLENELFVFRDPRKPRRR